MKKLILVIGAAIMLSACDSNKSSNTPAACTPTPQYNAAGQLVSTCAANNGLNGYNNGLYNNGLYNNGLYGNNLGLGGQQNGYAQAAAYCQQVSQQWGAWYTPQQGAGGWYCVAIN